MRKVNIHLSRTFAGDHARYVGFVDEKSLNNLYYENIEIYADKEGNKLLALILPLSIYLVEFVD